MSAYRSQTNGIPALFRILGRVCGWLLLATIVLQFVIVVLRYVFSANFVWASELMTALHATTIAMAIGWTLLANRHVRIDVLSSRIGMRGRDEIDRFGTLFFLFPLALAILISSFAYTVESWRVLEGSAEVAGLPGLFLVKSLVPLFALLLLLAAVLKLFSKRP